MHPQISYAFFLLSSFVPPFSSLQQVLIHKFPREKTFLAPPFNPTAQSKLSMLNLHIPFRFIILKYHPASYPPNSPNHHINEQEKDKCSSVSSLSKQKEHPKSPLCRQFSLLIPSRFLTPYFVWNFSSLSINYKQIKIYKKNLKKSIFQFLPSRFSINFVF